MLRDLLRFYRSPRRGAGLGLMSLDAYLDQRGYGRAFRDDHLYPMAAPSGRRRPRRSAATGRAFVRFCENHHLLRLSGRPLWRTVRGGSRNYVRLCGAPGRRQHPSRLRRAEIRRDGHGVLVCTSDAQSRRHDQVVIATTPTRRCACCRASADERRLLGAFGYTDNVAVLHSDSALMPRAGRLGELELQRPARARRFAERDLLDEPPAADSRTGASVPDAEPGAGAAGRARHPQRGLPHPVFDAGAMAAQARLWSLQGQRRSCSAARTSAPVSMKTGCSRAGGGRSAGRRRRPWQLANPCRASVCRRRRLSAWPCRHEGRGTGASALYSGWSRTSGCAARHRLRYRVFSLLLDIDQLPRWRSGCACFLEPLQRSACTSATTATVRQRCATTSTASCARQACPRAVRSACDDAAHSGLCLHPLNVYFCHTPANELGAILYEVNNTFGERHSYLIEVQGAGRSGGTIEQRCAKQLHVSPFMALDMDFGSASPRRCAFAAPARRRRGARCDGRCCTHVSTPRASPCATPRWRGP